MRGWFPGAAGAESGLAERVALSLPALVERALGHLKTLLPSCIWAEAFASAPRVGTRADSRDLG